MNTSVPISWVFIGFSSYCLRCCSFSVIIGIQRTKHHIVGRWFSGGGSRGGVGWCWSVRACTLCKQRVERGGLSRRGSSQRREGVCGAWGGPACHTGSRTVGTKPPEYQWRDSARLGRQRGSQSPCNCLINDLLRLWQLDQNSTK